MAALAAPLHDADAAAALPPLLAQLLLGPAPGDASALPLSAELLRMRAMALRPCAHLGCASHGGAGGEPLKRGKRCLGCKAVRCCSEDCQTADWPFHKVADRWQQQQQQQRELAAAGEEAA